MDGAAAAPTLATTKIPTAHRKMMRGPIPSTSGPAMTVDTLEVNMYPVITQGRSETPPRSAASSGMAAVTASASKATRAVVVNIAIETGNRGRDRTPMGRSFTGEAYALADWVELGEFCSASCDNDRHAFHYCRSQ
jgi:hypothetical protein